MQQPVQSPHGTSEPWLPRKDARNCASQSPNGPAATVEVIWVKLRVSRVRQAAVRSADFRPAELIEPRVLPRPQREYISRAGSVVERQRAIAIGEL